MNETINITDELLLKKASDIYNVPYHVLASVYRLGRNEGYIQGLNK